MQTAGATAPTPTADAADRPAGQPDAVSTGPEGSAPRRTLAQRIEDAQAMVAYQDMGGGLKLAFKVRPVGVAEAAQTGLLMKTVLDLVAKVRKPDAEDMTGLEAAQMDAARPSDAELEARRADRLQAAITVARQCVLAVEDIDQPGLWRQVVWVDSAAAQGEDEGGVRLHLETVLTQSGLERIALAALKPAKEVAGAWGRFRR